MMMMMMMMTMKLIRNYFETVFFFQNAQIETKGSGRETF